MGRILAVTVTAALLALAVASRADDVTIKTINPDPNKPATQPDQPAKPTDPTKPATPAWTPPVVLGGDWMVGQAFQMAKVTDEQKEKLKPVLDEMAATAKEDWAKTSALQTKQAEAYKAAREAGVKDFMSDEGVKAAMAEVQKLYQDIGKASEKRREKLLAAIDGVLSADQVRLVKEQFERYSSDPAVRNKPLARDWMKTSFPGVALTVEQQDKIVAKVAPVQEKFGQQIAELQKAQGEKMQQYFKEDPKTAWQKAYAEFGPKLEEARLALSKAINEAIEANLTDEQKKQAAAGRQEVWKKSVLAWVEQTVKSFEPAKLTDEQKAKVKELAAAAGDAMLKTDMYDTAGRNDLAGKLREDIKKLLTDEQKAKVR